MSIPLHCPPALRKRAARIKRELQRALDNGGMPRFLDALFGAGNWAYDEREKLWIVPDHQDKGSGKAYYCIRADGSWFKARVPVEVAQ